MLMRKLIESIAQELHCTYTLLYGHQFRQAYNFSLTILNYNKQNTVGKPDWNLNCTCLSVMVHQQIVYVWFPVSFVHYL